MQAGRARIALVLLVLAVLTAGCTKGDLEKLDQSEFDAARAVAIEFARAADDHDLDGAIELLAAAFPRGLAWTDEQRTENLTEAFAPFEAFTFDLEPTVREGSLFAFTYARDPAGDESDGELWVTMIKEGSDWGVSSYEFRSTDAL